MRGSKTVNGVKHEYYYVGSQLRYEKYGTTELYFNYDSAGNLSAIYLYQNNILTDVFFTVTNIQGDVVSIYSSGGTLLANYEYDDWGNVIAIKSADGALITNTNHISYINPIRYRGYYFDTETGLYYLQSRYYNPKVGRFLNADSLLDTSEIIGFNVFAYCGDNPINRFDPTGHSAMLSGAIFGGIVGAVAGAVNAYIKGTSIKAGAIIGAATGALGGAVAGAVVDGIATAGMSLGVGIAVTSFASGILSFAGDIANQYANSGFYDKETDQINIKALLETNIDYISATKSAIISAAVAPFALSLSASLASSFYGITGVMDEIATNATDITYSFMSALGETCIDLIIEVVDK